MGKGTFISDSSGVWEMLLKSRKAKEMISMPMGYVKASQVPVREKIFDPVGQRFGLFCCDKRVHENGLMSRGYKRGGGGSP